MMEDKIFVKGNVVVSGMLYARNIATLAGNECNNIGKIIQPKMVYGL